MYKTILFIAFACIFTSCFKERIELDYNVDENKKIVITGWINTLDEPQFISVSQTVNYLGEYVPDMVKEATVTLKDEVDQYALEEKEEGLYYLPEDWTPRVGDDYELKVVYEGKEYTAVHKMRACPEIENLDYLMAEDLGEEDTVKVYTTVFDFKDLEGEGDAYYGLDYRKGSLARDSFINGQFADDRFVDGDYFSDIVLSEEDRYFEIGDTAVVEFHSIGWETSEYLEDIESEIYRGGPFDPPPANIRTNIVGGAIGYFIISDGRRGEVVIE